MAESMNNDNDLLSYINEDFISNDDSSKNDFNEELYSNFIKTEPNNNNKGTNTSIDNLTEKNKIELAQANIYNSITNNYNSSLPLSPPQDNDINSPNNEIYLNSQTLSSQNIPSQNLSLSNSPSMEVEALSPSSIGSDVNDINNEETNLMNLTNIYQNNGLMTTDGLINPSLISLSNPELIDNSTLFNTICTNENNESQLFPPVLPNTSISIPPSSFINDSLNPLSAVNITLPTETQVPVTLNTNISLPTVTVPSNSLEFSVPSNTLNINSTLATTAGLDLNNFQTLTPLNINGPLAITNPNTLSTINSTMNPSSAMNNTSTPTTSSSTTESTQTNTTATSSSSTSSSSTATTQAPLSATLDLKSIKSSVNETLELTKKLSQANGTALEGKSIDVTDILKSDVAASCLNLLKGSKGKPGRKKKCLQSPSEANNTTSNSSTASVDIKDSKTFPFLSALNGSNDSTKTNSTNNPLLSSQSIKFPIIKPKTSTNDNHAPLLPLVPSTTKSNSINCFSASTTKPLNPPLLRPSPTPILPNGSDKTKSNTTAAPAKTAYQKRQERLLKNREAAHLSRKRKREQLHMLETHAQELIAENQTLKLKVIELEQLNEKLVNENKLLKLKMGMGDVKIKKEELDESTPSEINNINTTSEIPNDIYNLYIKPEVLSTSSTPVNNSAQNKSSTKTKEIGIVFMVLLFSFSLFTFPLSIFSAKENNTEISRSLISSFMNKLNDFSLASISADNAGKIISSGYEQEKPYLLDSGHDETMDLPSQELEVSTIVNNKKRNDRQLVQFKKSRKLKNGGNSKPKSKRNTTRRNIKKNYEYTSYHEISSLMSVFHPKNVDLDEDSLKQMSLLQHWIVEGFCSIHENHTYAKDPSNVKDIIKIYNEEDKNQGSTDLTLKTNNHGYDSSKNFSKEIPWNMKQYIKFYPDTTYFYSPKLVQLFPLSSNDILEPSIPLINRLQPNDTAEATVTNDNNTTISPSSSSTSSYYSKRNEENQKHNHQSTSKSESQDNDNVYHLPFTNKPKMAIITNLESDNIDEETNSYLMIDFEIKGARLIESE